MQDDLARPLRRDLFRAVGFPDGDAELETYLAPLAVWLGPRRMRLVENAIIVPGLGILGPDGDTLPEGLLRGLPDRVTLHGSPSIEPVEPAAEMRGDALHLGWFSGHFGHFLVEAMARWWAVAHVEPGMPLTWLWSGATHPESKPPVAGVDLCLGPLGIDTGRVALPAVPTRVERLLLPAAAFERRGGIHEDAALPYQEIGDRLVGAPPLTDQPLYLSRSRLSPRVRNIEDETVLEDYLRGEGVLVIHPETLPLAEQIRLVRSHRTLIAPWGSALHLTLFTEHQPRIHMLTREWINTNYLLWADALGTPLTCVSCLTPVRPSSGEQRNLLAWNEVVANHLHAEGLVRDPARLRDLLAQHRAGLQGE